MSESSSPSTKANDVIPMAQMCPRCMAVENNTDPEVRHPLDFLESLRRKGWSVPAAGGVHFNHVKCPKCASS